MIINNTPTPAQAAIRQVNVYFVNAFHKHDAQGIARHYTPGGKLLPAHSNIIVGRPAIGAFWQGVLDMGLCCTERKTIELQSAAIGHEIGAYMLRMADGQPVDAGLYIALWQWTEGRWQIRYEVWQSGWPAAWGDRRVVGSSSVTC